MSRTSHTNKDLAEMESLAREQKWNIERLGSDHWRWTSPEGPFVDVASTPSNVRSVNNIRAELKRAGLITERGEWQRVKREMKAAEREADKVIKAVVDALVEGRYVQQNNTATIKEMLKEDIDLERLYAAINPETGLFDMKCPCGKLSAHPHGYLTHLRKCPVYLETEGNVDRNLKAPPPAEQRLDCPDCGQWYWINQPDHLERHVMTVHGKSKCYTCGKYFPKRSIYRHQQSCMPVSAEVDLRDEEPKEVPKVDLVTPSRAVTHERVGAIATPEELELLVNPPEPPKPAKPTPAELEKDRKDWKPAASNGKHHPPEGLVALDGRRVGHPAATGLSQKIRQVMAEVGHIEIDESVTDPNITAVNILHELVGKEFNIRSLQSIIGQMAERGELTRVMAGRKTRAITWASATQPPEDTRQEETPMPAAPAPAPRPATVTAIKRGPDVSDDDLWTLLEMVLAEPVQLNRETYSLINDWMSVTRKLFQLKGK